MPIEFQSQTHSSPFLESVAYVPIYSMAGVKGYYARISCQIPSPPKVLSPADIETEIESNCCVFDRFSVLAGSTTSAIQHRGMMAYNDMTDIANYGAAVLEYDFSRPHNFFSNPPVNPLGAIVLLGPTKNLISPTFQ